MDAYDDRPISVYDNLNVNVPATMHTSTPKAKTQTTPAAAATAAAATATSPATATANGVGEAAPSYADISFKFNLNNNNNNNNNKMQQQQQSTPPLPNGNRSFSQSPQQQQQQVTTPNPALQQASFTGSSAAAVNAGAGAYYTTPLKQATINSAAAAAATTATTTTPPLPSISSGAAVRAGNAGSAQRPLSQHSQSEPNEASQSIAAVKAALSDAKSKFFGLNGYAPDSHNTSSNTHESQPAHYNRLLPPPSAEVHNKPKVQIVIPPPKPQPKYQNIPENSAIFRNQQQPPERPPKPSSERYHPHAAGGDLNAPSVSARAQTPESATYPLKMPSAMSESASSYKQIPLNDIEASHPSQAVYMSTTVPQNIKGTKIAGRHTPTRNSLRHSRMLVVNNKNYQGIQHPNPLNFKHPNVARWLLILHVMIGLLIAFLAIWIFLLAPNTAVQDNPYWSGLALLVAGSVGLLLVRYQRIKRHKVRENCFLFLRTDSYILELAALLLCAVALICAALHFARLTANDTRCEPTNILLEHGSCSCTFNAVDAANVTAHLDSNGLLDEEVPEWEDNSYKVEYRDLSCQEVIGEWTFLLGLSITLNSLGFLVVLLYIALLSCCRHDSKQFYSSVHTSTF